MQNFRVAGQEGDPTAVPGFPAEYRPYFGKGKGGFQFAGAGIDVEPRCVELAKRKNVYRAPAPSTAADWQAAGSAAASAGYG